VEFCLFFSVTSYCTLTRNRGICGSSFSFFCYVLSFYLSFFLLVVHARSIYLLILVIIYCLHHQRLFLLLTVFYLVRVFFSFLLTS
jgi:hypothetical protein